MGPCWRSGADMFPFFRACQVTQTHSLVRAAQNRRVEQSEEEIHSSLDRARSWPSQASRPLEVPLSLTLLWEAASQALGPP